MRVGSLFSGVGGFDLGFERAGMELAWHSEIEPHACAVLRERWPDVPNLGDVTKIDGATIPPVDVICGGFPCQDLSVAGKRRGFEGERSVLAFEFLRIVREMREATDGAAPTFLVLENVPGLFSSSGGRDFARLLDELGELGPMDVAWRVLDSRYFGVAQRRRRVFVVVDFGGERCDEILALTEGLRGDSPTRRTAREDVTKALRGRANASHREDSDTYCPVVSPALMARDHKGPSSDGDGDGAPLIVTHSLRADGFDASEDGTGAQGVAAFGVRRLTPRECERLQGFPDTAKSVIIAICGEKQKNDVGVALRSLDCLRDASPVEENVLKRFAPYVELQSVTRRPDLAILADLSVLIDSERGRTLIHSHGRSLWSASDADDGNWSLLPMRGAAFVRLAVDTMQCLEQATPCGEEDSLPNSGPSVLRLRGNALAVLSGREIDDAADDAEQSITTESKPSTPITSRATGNSPRCDSSCQTLCSSVVRAIASFIPEPTWRESGFVLRLTIVSPWTRYGRKPNGTRYELADGPRYKCMGNAVTVSVAEWIGKRIAAAVRAARLRQEVGR